MHRPATDPHPCAVPDCPEPGEHECDEGEFFCDLHAAALVLLAMRARTSLERRAEVA